ncbi:hypothetical protein ASG72_00845 [Bosea sp. Leaf344]|uniref:protein-disulfide reductase DsbD domain-containing protein n=1 Tax=Bosea sp. Leaf344 TaxID=1736346 RepID=UPI0006F2E78B|nr:protein-disulfide reductase DsbD domain-containing protein [Bosea sp. Leaf344]KQU54232.1 hypothetical protein ASG72_00845 [Bosea sp. Leaf344]
MINVSKTLALLATLLVLASAPVRAQQAAVSPWSKSDHASLRLIAGATSPSGKQRIGVEIVMAQGYKTYWRSAGDYGAPPRFDWSGSVNVGGLDVRWPAPERFADGFGHSIGYVGEVVIPVSVQPADPTKPVLVVLALDYAICDKICIPVKGEARLWLEPGVTAVTSPRLEMFEARVPVPVKPGAQRDGLGVNDARIDMAAPEPGLRFSLHAPPNGRIDDIFVEGPGQWSFAKPVLTPQPDGTVLAQLRIKERPKGAAGPLPFVVTLSGAPQPVEARLELDIPAGKP